MPSIRLAAAAFKMGAVNSFDDFGDHVSRLVDQAAAHNPDFLVFPEMFTMEIMNSFSEEDFLLKLSCLARQTGDYVALFRQLAREKGFHIVAGSHLVEDEGKFYNVSHLFAPDGQVLVQRKCHLFPMETLYTAPGDRLHVFPTEKAKIAILTCYDLEFPEAARLVTLNGAEVIFSPSATLDEQGYWRVRHSGQARCIEDQVYVVHCGLIGEAAGLNFWGMASILTPCEPGFPIKGVAAESPVNEEAVIVADVDTDRLHEIRAKGAATTLKDRRWDVINALYQLECSSAAGAKARTGQ
ncbi:MAG: carbon-nitrogen hydrolase family protein [Thermodesulfobacteriota bacterium]